MVGVRVCVCRGGGWRVARGQGVAPWGRRDCERGGERAEEGEEEAAHWPQRAAWSWNTLR